MKREFGLMAPLASGLFLFVSLVLASVASASVASPSPEMTDQQKLSYAIGVVFGSRLQQESNQLDMDVFEQGLRDSYQGKLLKLTDQEIKEAFNRYQQAQELARRDHQKAFETLAQQNLERGQAFLEENLKQKDVKQLQPGLQYQVIKEGAGAQPSSEDTVTVHFEGKLLNGSMFDGSRQLEGPVEFQVNQAPLSWMYVLPNMKVGAVWRIWVSPELGFGSGGAGPVGPNEVLEYELELLSVSPH